MKHIHAAPLHVHCVNSPPAPVYMHVCALVEHIDPSIGAVIGHVFASATASLATSLATSLAASAAASGEEESWETLASGAEVSATALSVVVFASGCCATSIEPASQHALESVTVCPSLAASLPGIVGALHATSALPLTNASARAKFR